jgi:hypothetical protein
MDYHFPGGATIFWGDGRPERRGKLTSEDTGGLELNYGDAEMNGPLDGDDR